MSGQDEDDEARRLRRRAEEKLRERVSDAADPAAESNALALLHELQVHQLELEMQNETLQQARIEAEAARDLFTQLYDHAPMAYFNLDSLGRLHRTNLAGARLLDTTRSELTGRRLATFVSEEDRPRLADLLYKVFAGQASEHAELPVTTMAGVSRILRVEACAGQAGPDTCLLAAVDITDLAESHQALMVAASVYETLDEAVMIADAGQRIILVNPAFVRLTGFDVNEVLDQCIGLIRAYRESPAFEEQLRRSLHTTGRWQGEILHRHRSGEHYMAWVSMHLLRDDRGVPMRYISVFRDITEQRRAEEAIWRQANYDPLTELPNRLLFLDRLRHGIRQAQRRGQVLALLFIDLDKFKEINDRLGHDAGDTVLKEAARRISRYVRTSDTTARLSGDEFTVIMGGLESGGAGVDEVGAKILKALDQPFEVAGTRVALSASIGTAFCPGDATDPASLIKCADRAMYVAKQAGGQRMAHFSLQLDATLQEREALIRELPDALERGQFRLCFQPIVALDTRLVVMFEALLRWEHPRRGLLNPDQFLALADTAGLLGRIDEWVFQQSLNALEQLNARRGEQELPLKIAINESSPDGTEGVSVETWRQHLSQSAVSPGSVIIEVTEHLLQEPDGRVDEWINEVHASGLKIALSQFGISKAGIPCLQRYPFDLLKIDRGFVHNMPHDMADRAIVHSIIDMAHRMGLKVVAEGVETDWQHELLRAAHCDYAQGYLFGKPLPVGRILAEMTPSG
ncbi:putative bifunctional diguanylate cyclase/phosphodiesterase [Ectothiorhodospira shaposhnikovii]|uniref:putative bifunctional diguanylate cyclase/phosphodiesterase n=1 Tax=Ectothiorhodospira shaposhnikovii TaxID=1054 RepID=UPI001904B843|nr:EAL domain-containing protein [Ectothiorhodospira shaposhnikovii]